jgi:oxazoline/thiazoline synthase
VPGFPRFKPHLRAEVIPTEGVVVLSENGARALHGKVYELVTALIDGAHDADSIVDALAGQLEPAMVYYALALLEKNGYICESSPTIPPEAAGFWSGLDLDPRAALAALAARRVRVRTVGDVDAAPLSQALETLGITVTEDDGAEFEAVVTDDFLRAGLTDVNRAALARGRPWLLVKPGGVEPWIGPLFVPPETACYQCLRQRLQRNRLVHTFVADKKGLSEIPRPGPASLSATVDAACDIAAVEVAKFLAGAPLGLAGKVLSVDARDWAVRAHALLKHPGCEACGLRAEPTPRPLVLASRRVSFAEDGGHRAVTPEETLEKYRHHVSPITGVVNRLFPVRGDGIAFVYLASHNPAIRIDRVDTLKRGLRHASSGKGMSDIQAKTSALCEAIERYSGEFTGTEPRIAASFRALGGDAVHPGEVMRFSARQYREREAWNSRRSRFNVVPEPFDEEARIDWTPVWSLTQQRHKYLPTELLYFGARASTDGEASYCVGCSNGNASGNNLEEAVLQGALELVERDAVAMWWYNRLKKPGVDVASFDDRRLMDLLAYYGTLGRDAWALDLTSDLGIPAFAAVSRLRDAPEERILFGLGCHLDPRLALQRAFGEMNQILGMAEAGGEDGSLHIEDRETLNWLTTATVANQPYLTPDDRLPLKRRGDYATSHRGDLIDDILLCRRLVEERGMEMLVLDQTRADVGMPVVKVIVPGLRHFWARFAPGRLYDVPVQMGWLDRPLREEELNPFPMFL